MVSPENRKGLYITIPIYFCLLAGATYWAYRRMERMAHNKTADKLSAHYIGGREFGPLIITGTLFASTFSGYTVVGIPNEAFRTGWLALRWLPTMAGVCWGLMGTGFRLRKVSQFRNHQSPADFITDRFQSQSLRYTVVFLQILTAIIYLAAQVIALKSTFNSIFGLDPDSVYPVIIIMILILIFECIGGLNSVAFTDSIQGVIMVFSFVAIPILIAKNYGGWSSLDPETYPQPSFYQTPTADSQWSFWQFGLINFSFFTLPHFIQRIYAVRDLQSLRIGYGVLCLSPWITSFVGVFMGTMGVAILVNPEDGSPMTPADPFTSILEALMDVGGFAEACACIGITASLAAIMSTADSLIIAISQLVTVEIFYPMMPSATPATMSWWGRMASLFSVALALVVGLAWNEGITDLGKIQFPLTIQVIGPFLIGLFAKDRMTDVHPWCITAAVISSSIWVVAIYFGYLRAGAHPNPLAIDSGITGVCWQAVLIVFFETFYRLVLKKENSTSVEKVPDEKALLYPNRPAWDIPKMSRFGESTLTPEGVCKSMDGFYEPMASGYWNALMFATISFVTPLVAPSEPPLAEDGTFLYLPNTVHGLPWWAFKIILLSVIPFVVLLAALYKIPRDFPMEDEVALGKKGVDVDLVSLTRQELGRRSSYDEPNVLIQQRRSSISTTMAEMGIQPTKVSLEEAVDTSASHKRLSNLIYARNLDVVSECTGNDGTRSDEQAKEEVVVDL
mmetsp:Transcript_616/g.1462  ORF Transcript_616/g.1462 Transcript_616/m.1462 type:complete len:734 (-) Transcript_616:133-2334(-)|eukprot:CAMPEP_0116125576 /NCGR_PEP_ID=MMETSP0329-20121206/5881_1 /TAXON_ID=697910 /ORGANISM="Pseudo-nitzschia arenysensis, Strain B593" /LENGTH=733 /DNA_ID=CAMNT_0003619619 /DNA_START=60 /DNA_END=2261 /DNA_ORIENTATION=-